MVLDSSILVAIVLQEPDATQCMFALTRASTLSMSAASLTETSLVLLSRGGPVDVQILDALLAQLEVNVIAVDRTQALLAREAFERYGKGRHKARLNLGDCFVYALAKYLNEPLLFLGNDFTETDLIRA